jgi:hypothetical protein
MDSGIIEADGLAEIAGAMDLSMINRYGGRFVVDLLMADPFFYGEMIDMAAPVGTATPTVIDNIGHDRVSKMTITVVGPLVNAVLTNSSFNPDIVLTLGTIASGRTLTIDTDLFTATDDLDANYLANIGHTGSHFWMELEVGNNTLELTADSGAGTFELSFQPPYL